MAGKKSAGKAAANKAVNEETLNDPLERDPLFGAADVTIEKDAAAVSGGIADDTTAEPDNGKLTPEGYIKLADAEFNQAMREGRYPEIVDALGDLGYSVRNVMLIKNQMPEASHIGGMNFWNYNKRSIVKGSKAIKVLAPKFGGEQSNDPEQVADGQKKQKATGYKMSPVFDISQTYGEELKQTRCDRAFIASHYDGVKAAIAAAAGDYAFNEGAKYTSVEYADKRVNIKEGLSNEDVLKAMIRAVACIRTEGKDREAGKEISQGKAMFNELKESAIAHLVSRRIGLGDTKLKTLDFSEFDDEGLSRVASDLNRVKSVAGSIAARVESYAADIRATETVSASDGGADESAEDIFGDAFPAAQESAGAPDEMTAAGMGEM